MPSKNTSTPKNAPAPKDTKTTIMVKRPGGYEFVLEAKMDMKTAVVHSKGFTDACDVFIVIDKMIPKDNKEENYIDWNMVEFRKQCRHKGDDEECVFIIHLRALLIQNGFIVETIGFPLNKDGDVECDDVLKIYIQRK